MHSTSGIIMSTVITEPSICIPRTLHNVNWRQVKDAFEQVIGKGTVERVDIVPSKNSESTPFCRIFVHFRYWPNSPEITSIRQRLVNGEVIKVVYDNPWFWKCSASRIPKPERSQPKTAAFIEYTTPDDGSALEELAAAKRAAEASVNSQPSCEGLSTPPPVERSESPPPRHRPVRGRNINTSVTQVPVMTRQWGDIVENDNEEAHVVHSDC